MRRRFEEVRALGGEVAAVSFEPRGLLLRQSRLMQLPFPLLSDPERDVYRAYQLPTGTASQVFGAPALFAYAKLLFQGRWAGFHRSYLRQLGGDFVIDAEGIVRFEYRSAAPHDRPEVDRLLRVLGTI